MKGSDYLCTEARANSLLAAGGMWAVLVVSGIGLFVARSVSDRSSVDYEERN